MVVGTAPSKKPELAPGPRGHEAVSFRETAHSREAPLHCRSGPKRAEAGICGTRADSGEDHLSGHVELIAEAVRIARAKVFGNGGDFLEDQHALPVPRLIGADPKTTGSFTNS
jgi:hypothetical protein